MNSLKDFLKILKLDLTKAVIIHDGGDGYQKTDFDLLPKDYLRFAKEDLEVGNLRGLINVLSNSKRAIDCQVDEVHSIFYLRNNNKKARDTFLSKFSFEPNTPIPLKLIQALNFAPSYLISKVRNIRNKIEHDYVKPQFDEVKEAVEIADLFIRSVRGKIWIIESHMILTDENKLIDDEEHHSFTDDGIYTRFDQDKKVFKIQLKRNSTYNGNEPINISSKVEEFFWLLRMTNSVDDEFEIVKSFKFLLDAIDHEIPRDKIRCKTI
ncbi:hypothetical protein [Fodinibius halophilus]|uniref:Uncharacterized protein n=1 Tax=Fodinibius halophilus TaxID=1736908 RepID=A0A6M1SX62_9BACT|nr:hypothetical protein [Fodinibius halophilus]NGP88488.1 hypothetical protein [Fodinibius halophilus]